MFVDGSGEGLSTFFACGFATVGVTDRAVAFRISDMNRYVVTRRSLLSGSQVDRDIACL